MPVLRPDTLVQNVLQLLAVVGEFPWQSLGLLGKTETVQKMVYRLSEPAVFRHRHTGEEVRTKLFVTNGKGREKSLRLYKGALSLLHWFHPGAYEYYMENFWNHHFPGDAAHRDRNHRVAEAVALCANAGVEVLLAAATNGNVTGDFYDQSKGGQALPEDVLHLDTAVGTSVDEAPTEKVYYQITGGEIQESGAIGSLTVTLQGTGETGEEENEEETSGQVVTNLPLRNATGEQPTPLYTTGTANVYRTDVLEGLLVMNGGDAITIEGTDYYLGGEIVNTYSSVSLGFSPNSLCYLQMQEGMSFRLEIDLNNLTIATVTG